MANEFGVLRQKSNEAVACTLCDGDARGLRAFIHTDTHRVVCWLCFSAMLRVHEAQQAGHYVPEIEP